MTDIEMEHVGAIAGEMMHEMRRATKLFGPFASGHEGYGVLKEELDELWDEIKLKDGHPTDLRTAIHLGAMAIRFVYDLCDQE